MKVRFRLQGELTELEVNRHGDELHIVLEDRVIRARWRGQDGDRWMLDIYDEENERWQQVEAVGVALDKQRRQLWLKGRHLQYERLPVHQSEVAPATAIDGSLSASIPSVVSELLVSVGDRVDAHQKLILLESMKMVIPIVAPDNGVVTAIHCAPGDAVEPGVPLIEMKGDES